MGFPSGKTHRRNRRQIGRNQSTAVAGVAVAVTSTGTTNVTLTFARPVVVTGNIGTTVATKTLSSQTIVSPTVVTQVWSGNVATLAYTLPAGDPNVRTQQGGMTLGAAGTFP
jgi:hypothetical protein